MGQTQLPTTPNLSTRLREATTGFTERTGEALHRLGVHPDVLTLAGLAVTLVACLFLAQGQLVTGAIILIVGLPLDLLDGAVARAMKRTNPFGGVLDSTIDRYADMLIMFSLSYYLAVNSRFAEMLLAFLTIVGSTMVSYVRARAGNAGLPCAGGLFSRFERLVVLLIMLLTGWLPLGLVILAAGSNLTALQRLWSVYQFSQVLPAGPNQALAGADSQEEGA